MNTFNIPDQYYVVALKIDERHPEGQTVFYAIDRHSGGYPYWSTTIGMAQAFDDVERAMSAFEESRSGKSYMNTKGLSTVRLVKATTSFVEVHEADIREKKIETAIGKLTDEEIDLLKVRFAEMRGKEV